MTQNTPPPDWYPDPSQPNALRYWDGNAWTHHVAARPTAVVTATKPPAKPRSRFRIGLTAMLLWLGFAAATLLICIGFNSAASSDAVNHSVGRGWGTTGMLLWVQVLCGPFLVFAVVFSSIWHAAEVRDLDPRSRPSQSPTWLWFVPIAGIAAPCVLAVTLARHRSARALAWLWAATTSFGMVVLFACAVTGYNAYATVGINAAGDYDVSYRIAARRYAEAGQLAAIATVSMALALMFGILVLRHLQGYRAAEPETRPAVPAGPPVAWDR